MAKRFSLLIPVILAFCFAGCTDPFVKEPATLRIALTEPDTLNPLTYTDVYAGTILGFINDSLLDRNRDTLEEIPKIAKSWDVSRDHLIYTFHLREDVKWHDGVPFTAEDVVYSFQKIMDPAVEAARFRASYENIAKVEKIDEYTVRCVLKRPYFQSLSLCGGIPLVPKHIFDDGKDFNSHPASRSPIGTGPYRFVEWKTNKRVVVVRNENYWDQKPEIKKIVSLIVTDPAVELQLLKKGEIDTMTLRPIQWVKQINSEKFNRHFHKFRYIAPGYSYIGWNNANPLFSDKLVRNAMTRLVNRQKILDKINFGLGRVIEGTFFIDSPQYDSSLPQIPFDPVAAQALLEKAGWKDTDGDGILDKDGKKFQFTFLYPSASKTAERIAPILKEDLKKVGIEMEIDRIEWAAFLGKIMKHEFEATSLGWSGDFEDDPYQVWHSSQAADKGSNFISFKNPEADRLIERARVEFDADKRNAIYHQFDKILYDEQPYTFLFASDTLEVVSKKFSNVKVHKMGTYFKEWKVAP